MLGSYNNMDIILKHYNNNLLGHISVKSCHVTENCIQENQIYYNMGIKLKVFDNSKTSNHQI